MTYAGMYTGDDVSINGMLLNRVDEQGCKWILEDLDGWWGLPEPNVPDDTRAFSEDGSYFAPGRYEARQITMSGIIVPPNGLNGPAAAAVARNTLNRGLNLVRSVATLRVAEVSTVTLDKQTVTKIPKVANVQLIGRPLTRFDDVRNVLKFNFQLRAADPRKYLETSEYGSTPLLASSNGRAYDKIFDYSYGASGSDGAMTIVNQGSYITYGVLRIVGPVVNPTIEHVELGKILGFNMTLGNGEYLDVNLRDRTVLFNSTASRRAALKPNSAWFWLIPGTNTLRYTGTQTIPARPDLAAAANRATNPSFETPYGTDSTRVNFATSPRPFSTATAVNWGATAGTSETGTTIIGGITPAPAGLLIRSNFARNPRPATVLTDWVYQAGTGETSASSIITDTPIEDAPLPGVTSYARRSISIDKTTGSSGWYYRTPASTFSGVAGDVFTLSMYVRSSVAVAVLPSVQLRAASSVSVSATSPSVTLVPNEWTRISVSATAVEAIDGAQLWAVISSTEFTGSGVTVDASSILIEKSPTLGDYFDGDLGDVNGQYDQLYVHTWVGTANLSVSRENVSVAPGATGPTGLIGFERRLIQSPKTGGVSNLFYLSALNDITFAAGVPFTLSAYVRSSHAVTVDPTMILLNGATTVNTITGSAVTLVPGEWTRISATVTTTATVNRFRLNASLAASQIIPSLGFFDMTTVLAEGDAATALSYFDGSYKDNVTDGANSWIGTPDLSISILAVSGVRQLGGSAAAMTVSGGGTSRAYQSNLWSSTGSYSFAVEAIGASSNNTAGYPAGTTGGLTKLNMSAGQTYTVSADIFLTAAQATSGISSLARRIVIDVTTPSGTTSAYASSNQAPNEAGSYRLATSFTLPSDTTNVVLRLMNGALSGVVRWDALMIELGTTSGTEYMDGDFPYAVWAGVAHASMSSRPRIEGVPESVIQLTYRSAWIE